jgi:hypothetical protein
LEKIVFFEWRLSELSAELTAAQSRCVSANQERVRAEDQARAAHEEARIARRQLAELEAERARLASLVARPAGPAVEGQSLAAERDRAARLQAELEETRRQLDHGRAERDRWLTEMIEQARSGDEAPAALAEFISELRGEVIALRERQQRCDEQFATAGIAPPPPIDMARDPQRREPEPLKEARKLWSEGRIGGALPEVAAPKDSGAAARALADQCLRNLSSGDPARREQAARHLAALPMPAAAPLLATALSGETDAKARAQMARALVACGGEGAADIVAQLQSATEPPLVRLAAAEALCTVPSRARAAIDAAALDEAAAVRRRAAALAAAEGLADLLARLARDADASVRAAAEAACREAPPPPEEPVRDLAADAFLAVQSAIFGLSEAELGERLGVSEPEAVAIAARLVSARRIGRRGKRLVAAEGNA